MQTHLLFITTGFLVLLARASPIIEPASLPENFVVGGNPAPDGITFVALIVSFQDNNPNYGWLFTGCLISTRHTLTVGQAIHDFSNWQVGLGNVNRHYMQYFDVSDSEIHPAYNAANLHNNIGILIMPENIPPFLALPISLPPDNIISSPMYTYYGFGITDPSDFNSIPDIVKMGHTNSLPQEACIAIFGGQLITNGTWCGGQFMSSLCHGDQGGPVIHVLLNYLVGLSNFWMNPCNSGNPDVFVRVDYHITWINTIIAAPIS